MKKLLALFGCVAALSFGCASSAPVAKVPESNAQVPAAEPTTRDVQTGSWVYTVPYNFEKKIGTGGLVSYWAPSKVLMVAGSENPYQGTLPELVADKTELMVTDFNMTVLGIKPVDVDGTEGDLVVTRNDTVFLISLVVVENNKSLIVTCGGYLAVAKQSIDMCAQVLDSVKHSK